MQVCIYNISYKFDHTHMRIYTINLTGNGCFYNFSDDVKGVRIVLGVGVLVALISAVGLGVAYAAGAQQVGSYIICCPQFITPAYCFSRSPLTDSVTLACVDWLSAQRHPYISNTSVTS